MTAELTASFPPPPARPGLPPRGQGPIRRLTAWAIAAIRQPAARRRRDHAAPSQASGAVAPCPAPRRRAPALRRPWKRIARVLGCLAFSPAAMASRSLAQGADPALTPASAPRRVVSMNLCTDQLGMALAAPGQLISVSFLARDPLASLMAEQAAGLPVNHGQAEEIYLLKPDLVLAGAYSGTATVEMLRRLGVRVEVLPPANSLQDLREGLRQMGQHLGREPQAEAMIANFDADLAAIPTPPRRPLAASYDANGYSAGGATLGGDVMRAAGYDLVPDRLGQSAGGTLSLEDLVLAAPALIVAGSRYPGGSRAEEILDHPALAQAAAKRMAIPDRDWICGLPEVAAVAARLAQGGQP